MSGCHNAVDHGGGVYLEHYDDIKNYVSPFNPDGSRLLTRILSTDSSLMMPKPGHPRMMARHVQLIRTWINEGASYTPNCTTACDSTNISFTNGIKPILEDYCIGCHNSMYAAGNDFTDTAQIRIDILYGGLLDRIKHQGTGSPMPTNIDKMRDCNISQISRWIAAGAPMR
jgi:hypothetical protein